MQPIQKMFAEIPPAIWASGPEGPLVYRGKPIEMVREMASELGPEVTPTQAINLLTVQLASQGRIRLTVTGDPPEDILAGIFVYALLQSGILRPVAQA